MSETLDPAKLLEFIRFEAEHGNELIEWLLQCNGGTLRKLRTYWFVLDHLGRYAVFSEKKRQLNPEYVLWRDDYLRRNFGCE